MGAAWPLIGRGEEQEFVRAALTGPGEYRGIVIAGAPGVGKTRLARESLAMAKRRGATVRWAVATASARTLPLGAFTGMFGGGATDDPDFVRWTRRALLGGAHSAVVIGVDDAHLLDSQSALVLQDLVLNSSASVITTVRSGEPVPDAVTALWKDGHLLRLEVQPLSDLEIATLAATVLNGPLEVLTQRRLCFLSRGSPLYLRELIDFGQATGQLHRSDGLWTWSGDNVMSPSLVELIETRIGRITRRVREVCEVLALAEPLDVTLLDELTDPHAVEEAEDRGLITVEQSAQRWQARLAHPLYGEVLRTRIGLLRARRLRGRIALCVATGGRADDTLQRATLLIDSDREPDPDLFLIAARRSMDLLDPVQAERFARAVVSIRDGYEPRGVLCLALSVMNRGSDAEAELAALAEFARTDSERTETAFTRAGNLTWALRRPDDAEELLDAAERHSSDPAGLAMLAAVRAGILGTCGHPEEAVRIAGNALAHDSLTDLAIAIASWGLLIGLGDLGRTDQLDAAASRGYAAATGIARGVTLMGLTWFHIEALRLAGHLREAGRIADERRADGSMVGTFNQALSSSLSAAAALGAGHLGAAQRHARDALIHPVGWRFMTLIDYTTALAVSGDAAAASRALTDLDNQRDAGFAYRNPDALLARAWVSAAHGSVTEATTIARSAAETAHASGQLAQEVYALQTAVRFGDRTVATRLSELAARVGGPRAPAAAAHAAALAANDGDQLDAVSERLDQMGDLLSAADAAAQAATAHSLRQKRAAARLSAARASYLADQCEGAHTPALLASAHPLPLTAREREIVTLAAQGMSNRAIAERLILSVRTVEGHMYRAKAKLGGLGRAELAQVLLGKVTPPG